MTAVLAFLAVLAWPHPTDPGDPPKAYQRPPHRALLRGTACIPLKYLLLNRAIPAIHSYSRSVACESRP